MNVFITGGTGFIGSRVLQKLVQRGDRVRALVRSVPGAELVRAMGAEPVTGDLNDRAALRQGMQGCDLVFHIAGWYKIGSPHPEQAEIVNVEGTRSVLTTAFELGVPRIVYTSTIAVFGDTRGRLVDESYHMPPTESFLSAYDRTKYRAHYEVAVPLIRQGAPLIIVQPGAVYGPGDPSLVGQLMRLYHHGLLPVLPGPELTLTYAHVEDVAEGHILAADRGRIGESYILAGPVYRLDEMAQIWAQVTGRQPPRYAVPARKVKRLIPLVAALRRVIPLPDLISPESIRILGASYIARPDKAVRELGWQVTDIYEGMRLTFRSYGRPALRLPEKPHQQAGLILALAAVLMLAWQLSRRRR
jgi:nucleoside-diphosphate-sugar epimerase